MDWPSRELSQRLAEWGLCSPQDLDRCRASVRRFIRELPAFDSVWIDALAQHRILTSYQARILDSPDPQRLRLAGYVIADCLEENAWRAVYRARPLEGGPVCLLTVQNIHADERLQALEALDETIARLRGETIRGLNSPVRAEAGPQELIVVSPDVRGLSLRELLVQRGRFPAADVLAIARSLAETLAAAEGRGVVHGDVRPRNVRLEEQGSVHLLSPGLVPAVMPTFFVTQELPLDVSDGIAPELAPGGRAADGASEQYALGCLLWQLVAGRPPFPTGDAHAKVLAHQTKQIADVRDFAPQTPAALADVIGRLTRRSAADRFPSMRFVQQAVGPYTATDQRRLKRFLSRFETEAPTQTAKEARPRQRQWPSALAAVAVGSATIWLLASDPATLRQLRGSGRGSLAVEQPGALPGVKGARPVAAVSEQNTLEIVQASGSRFALPASQPLPAADASGTIWLKPGIQYEPAAIKVPGPLVVRASDGLLGRIAVGNHGWDLQADTVRFENVQLECSASVRMQSRGLEVVHCVVVGSMERSPVLEWRPRDAAAAAPGALTLTDSQFANAGLLCVSRPSFVRITNCLKTGAVPLLNLPAQGRAHQALPVHVIHATLRDSGPLLAWAPGSRAAGQRIELLTKACIFAPADGSSLLAITGSLAPPEWERSLSVGGLESLLKSGARLVDLLPPPGKPRGPLDATKLEVEGLMSASIEFFGTELTDIAASGLKSTDALFAVDHPPGIDASKVAVHQNKSTSKAGH